MGTAIQTNGIGQKSDYHLNLTVPMGEPSNEPVVIKQKKRYYDPAAWVPRERHDEYRALRRRGFTARDIARILGL